MRNLLGVSLLMVASAASGAAGGAFAPSGGDAPGSAGELSNFVGRTVGFTAILPDLPPDGIAEFGTKSLAIVFYGLGLGARHRHPIGAGRYAGWYIVSPRF